MKTMFFDLEEERLKKEIAKRGVKTVLLQLPEGLRSNSSYLAKTIEDTGAMVIVSADPCFGACDIDLTGAEKLGVDLIVHYGHSPLIKQERVPIIYLEARSKINVKKAVNRAISLLKPWCNIGLVTTIQHVHRLDEVKELLLKAGKTVKIGDAGLVRYSGQVIGCNFSNAKSISNEVDAFLFIGGGRFHAIGAALATAKPIIVADPYEKRAYSIVHEAHRVLKKRWASIAEAKGAERFGVLIGLKNGQKKNEKALQIRDELRKNGRSATLFALREITPQILMQFSGIDAFVNTACPRVSLDDGASFLKPILTFDETLVMLGLRDWEELCRSGWFVS